MQQITAIVCIGPNGLIGNSENKMPWYSRQDFFHFVYQTKYKPCIFGANTFFNMPKYPLPYRLNIVVSSRYNEITVGEFIGVPTFEAALPLLKKSKQIMLCGGAQLYKYCFDNNYIDNFLITRISSNALIDMSNDKANVFFPQYILDVIEQKWHKTEFDYIDNLHFPFDSDNGLNIRFMNYQKIR